MEAEITNNVFMLFAKSIALLSYIMIKSELYTIINGASTHARTRTHTHTHTHTHIFCNSLSKINCKRQQKHENSPNMGVRGLDTFAHKVTAMRMDTSAHERAVVSLDTLHTRCQKCQTQSVLSELLLLYYRWPNDHLFKHKITSRH